MVVVSFLTPLVAPRPPEVWLRLPLDRNDVVDAVEMGGCIGEKSRELPLVPDSSGDKDERGHLRELDRVLELDWISSDENDEMEGARELITVVVDMMALSISCGSILTMLLEPEVAAIDSGWLDSWPAASLVVLGRADIVVAPWNAWAPVAPPSGKISSIFCKYFQLLCR